MGSRLTPALGAVTSREAAALAALPAGRARPQSPTHQRTRPAMRLTEPPTITTPNTYDKKAWESTVRRIRSFAHPGIDALRATMRNAARAPDLKEQIGSDEQRRPSTECLSNRNRHKKTDKHQPDK